MPTCRHRQMHAATASNMWLQQGESPAEVQVDTRPPDEHGSLVLQVRRRAAAQPEVVVQVGHVGPPVHELHVLQGSRSVVEHHGCGPDDPGILALAQQPEICGTTPVCQ